MLFLISVGENQIQWFKFRTVGVELDEKKELKQTNDLKLILKIFML